jgi:hypothetical protein
MASNSPHETETKSTLVRVLKHLGDVLALMLAAVLITASIYAAIGLVTLTQRPGAPEAVHGGLHDL